MPYQWPQMLQALGQPELAVDPRFRSPRDRRDNKLALKEIIEKWMLSLKTRDRALQALKAQQVPCVPVLSLKEAMTHPYLIKRGTVRAVSDPLIGEFLIPGMPVKFSSWPQLSSISAIL